jgi:hypothetical protein
MTDLFSYKLMEHTYEDLWGWTSIIYHGDLSVGFTSLRQSREEAEIDAFNGCIFMCSMYDSMIAPQSFADGLSVVNDNFEAGHEHFGMTVIVFDEEDYFVKCGQLGIKAAENRYFVDGAVYETDEPIEVYKNRAMMYRARLIQPDNTENTTVAFNCGREFVKNKAPIEALSEALTFCVSEAERAWFCYGVLTETGDLTPQEEKTNG